MRHTRMMKNLTFIIKSIVPSKNNKKSEIVRYYLWVCAGVSLRIGCVGSEGARQRLCDCAQAADEVRWCIVSNSRWEGASSSCDVCVSRGVWNEVWEFGILDHNFTYCIYINNNPYIINCMCTYIGVGWYAKMSKLMIDRFLSILKFIGRPYNWRWKKLTTADWARSVLSVRSVLAQVDSTHNSSLELERIKRKSLNYPSSHNPR